MLFRLLRTAFGKPTFRSMSSSTEEVIFSKEGTAGVITLNRPKALNALNLNMVRLIIPTMINWRDDQSVSHVIIRGAGEKAFCAGGDIRAVTNPGAEGDKLRKAFFKEEYHLNNIIGNFEKPYIAMIHGVTMGGGVGLSVHGRYRIATERTTFAMPETAIGLFPDVGGGYFLPRLRGQLGLFLALTGHRLKGADTTKAGISSHFVDTEKLELLFNTLAALKDATHTEVKNVLDNFQETSSFNPTTDFSLNAQMKDIDSHFQFNTMEEILESLRSNSSSSEWCATVLKTLSKMSPTSMKITLRLLREGAAVSCLTDIFPIEYRLSQRCGEDHDFFEGVRAVLVDRDNNPKWKPDTVEGVTKEKVDWYFSNLEQDHEWKPIN